MRAALPTFALLLAAALAPTADAQARVTMALINGHVVTVDSTRPEAEAVAIAGDRIVAVGTNAEIQRLVTPATRVVDARGRLVVPGFIEGHGHFASLGESKLPARSHHRGQLGRHRHAGRGGRSRRAARRVDHRPWMAPGEMGAARPCRSVEGNPVHASLSAASPNNPVVARPCERPRRLRQRTRARARRRSPERPRTRPAARSCVTRTATRPGLLRESAQDLIEPARARSQRRTFSRAQRDARRRERSSSSREPKRCRKASRPSTTRGRASPRSICSSRWRPSGSCPCGCTSMVRGESNARMDSLLGRYRMLRPRRTATSPYAPSSARSTARSAPTARGCSSRTPICRRSTGLALEQPESLQRGRRPRAAARLSAQHARDRRPRQPRGARRLSSARSRRRPARAICGGASSTRSTSRRPTCRGSSSSASSRRCRGSTPSRTRHGFRPSSAPSVGSGSRISFGRSGTRAPSSPTAPTRLWRT